MPPAMPARSVDLKARALYYLALREHSRAELARKLARVARPDEDIGSLLDQLEASGLLSQTRFAESLSRRRAGRFGNGRVLLELKSHGIDDVALGQIKTELMQNESARAAVVRRKKFDQLPADAAERARQYRFLQQRGFSPAAIQAALGGEPVDGETD